MDEFEIHDISCDLGEDCTCGATESSEVEAWLHDPVGSGMGFVMTFFVVEPEPEVEHREFGPLEI